MGKIDNAAEKIEEHYLTDKRTVAEKLVSEITDKGLGLASKLSVEGWFLNTAISFLKARSERQTLQSFERQVLDLYKSLDKDVDGLKERFLTEERVLELFVVALERTFWGANENKVRRFTAVIANTFANATTDQQFQDAANFIRALDELSDDDIKVLNHLYKYQSDLVKENHHVDYNRLTERTRIEAVLRNVKDMQMDEFYSRCSRLSGYGLALPLERNTKFDPSEYMFRITLLGTRLIKNLTPERITQ